MKDIKEVKEKKFVSLLAIVAANLVPLVMVLLGRWGVGEVLLLYWLETGIVGAFTILKVLFASAPVPAHKQLTMDQVFKAPSAKTLPLLVADWGLAGKLLLSVFFAFPYVMFMIFQGLILYIYLAIVGGYGWPLLEVKWGLAALFAGHAVAFIVDYLAGGDFRRVGPGDCVVTPYHRLVVMQLVLAGGAWMSHSLGGAVYIMALFMGAKLLVELRPAKGYIG